MSAGRQRIRQGGIALITAMLVMALATIAAAAVLGSANAAIRRTATLIDGERAWWYADGVESWVLSILERDRKDNDTDSFEDKWTQKLDYLPVEQGGLSGELEDLQGRFNLNNLAATGANAKVYGQQFQRLFVQAGLEASQAQPVADAIRDWIDENQTPTGSGGEDSDYMGLEQPYRAANREMKSPSELLAVKGMSREIYLQLAPLVATLPIGASKAATKVNINTAPQAVLMALSEKPNEQEIVKWLEDRKKEPTKDPSELQKRGALSADATPDMTSTSTEYFLMKATAFIGSGRVSLYSVVRRPPSGPPIVIARSLDTE